MVFTFDEEKRILQECLRKNLSSRECATIFDTTHTQIRRILTKNNYKYSKSLKKWIINDDTDTETDELNFYQDQEVLSDEPRKQFKKKEKMSLLEQNGENILKKLEELSILTSQNSTLIDYLQQKVVVLEKTSQEPITLQKRDETDIKPEQEQIFFFKDTRTIMKQYAKLQSIQEDEDDPISCNFKIIKHLYQELRQHAESESLNRTALINILIMDYLKQFQSLNG